ADVSRRFYAALHARGLIELEERLLVSARDRLAATERLVRVVAATAVDVLGARVDVARQEQALARARGEARKAELELREALGIAGDVAFELAGDFPGVFDPSTLAADALVAAALAGHPRIAEADAAAAAAQRRARAARGTRWPQIGLNAGLSRGMSLSSYDALTELNPKNRTFFFGLSASLPLFEQFRPSAQIARAEAAVSDSREDARAARLALEREVRSALIDLENAHRSLELADQSAALSGERVALAQEQYRQGAIPFTSLQSVIEQAAAAEREAAAARLTFATALVTLEEKVGKELRP
ncbi:MAG: TolC family protein, partial [Gemmatimonadetes bacterium]|nr:TolC family protein [Gemmatimonadota bacterium]